MSNINTNATVTLTVNGKQAEDMLLKLKSQAANLEKAIEKAAAAGNKQQLTKLKRELKETNRQISQIENAAKGVEHILQRLDETSPKELNRTLSQLKRNLNGLERGSEEWNRQCEAIKRVKAEIAKVNSQLRENESLCEPKVERLADGSCRHCCCHHGYHHGRTLGGECFCGYGPGDGECAQIYRYERFGGGAAE